MEDKIIFKKDFAFVLTSNNGKYNAYQNKYMKVEGYFFTLEEYAYLELFVYKSHNKSWYTIEKSTGLCIHSVVRAFNSKKDSVAAAIEALNEIKLRKGAHYIDKCIARGQRTNIFTFITDKGKEVIYGI